MNNLPNIGGLPTAGDVTVINTGTNAFSVTFGGSLGLSAQPQIISSSVGLQPANPIATNIVTNPGSAGVNAVQVLTVTPAVSGGTFTITYGGSTTGPIAYDPNPTNLANNIQAALYALLTINNSSGVPNTTVTALTGTTFQVTFQNALGATNQPILTTNNAGLTGSNGPVTVTQPTTGTYVVTFGGPLANFDQPTLSTTVTAAPAGTSATTVTTVAQNVTVTANAAIEIQSNLTAASPIQKGLVLNGVGYLGIPTAPCVWTTLRVPIRHSGKPKLPWELPPTSASMPPAIPLAWAAPATTRASTASSRRQQLDESRRRHR